jgi:hypothetical protein
MSAGLPELGEEGPGVLLGHALASHDVDVEGRVSHRQVHRPFDGREILPRIEHIHQQKLAPLLG